MKPDISQIESAALSLSASDRANLARRLIDSLDVDVSVEREWVNEIARRVEELESGQVPPVPGEEVLEQARRFLE